MPPKTQMCSVCGAVTTKPQSYARKDGTRACRSHPEVAAEAQRLQEADRERLRRATMPKSPRFPALSETEPCALEVEKEQQAFRVHAHSHCWMCDQFGCVEGTPLRVAALLSLLGIDNETVRAMFQGLSTKRALRSVPYYQDDRGILSRVYSSKIRSLIPLLGSVLICADCAVKARIKDRWDAVGEDGSEA